MKPIVKKEKPVVDITKYQPKAWENWDFRLNSKGNIAKNSIQNIEVILENDPNLVNKLAYNEFTYDIEVLKDIILPNSLVKAGIVKNDLESALLCYFEKEYGVLFAKNNLVDAIVNTANRHRYNPVQDYFNLCRKNWDGQKRLPSFFNHFLGVEQTEITELITNLFFVGTVSKTFNPESKFDFVLDLIGGQGAGKTTLLQKLATPKWYTDSITDFLNKDNQAIMLRALIVNDDEMVATKKSDFEEVKKFVTQQFLEFRKPFDRRPERYNKNFVIARTSNHIEYLKDRTGERRFLPLLVNPEQQSLSPITDLTEEVVAQLWGEAVHLYESGFDFMLTKEQTSALVQHREQFEYKDALELEVEEYLEILIPKNFYTLEMWKRTRYIQDVLQYGSSDVGIGTEVRTWVTTKNIAIELWGETVANQRAKTNKIKYILDNLPNWKFGNTRINGKPKKVYNRIK